jgi:hypothetical protein
MRESGVQPAMAETDIFVTSTLKFCLASKGLTRFATMASKFMADAVFSRLVFFLRPSLSAEERLEFHVMDSSLSVWQLCPAYAT